MAAARRTTLNLQRKWQNQSRAQTKTWTDAPEVAILQRMLGSIVASLCFAALFLRLAALAQTS